MEAIILAGGFGTRLRPLTYTRAKSLLPILNEPMISYIINMLPKQVNKVILAVNYRKKQIENYFQNNDFGLEIIVNDEKKPLGTGGAVKFAEKHITDQFFVLNSDIICSLKLEEMMKFHKKNNAISTISLWPVENVSEFGVVDLKNKGKIIDFVEKPKTEDAPSNLINAGAYLLNPMILDYIDTNRLVSMEKEIFPQIIKDTDKFYGLKFEGYWMDIGRIKSYLYANKFLLEKNNLENCVNKDNEIEGEINKSVIGNNVIIEKNSKIESSIIYDNVVINGNVNISNCVIGENCHIGSFSTISNCVLGDKEKLNENSKFDNRIIWTQPIPDNYPKKQIGNALK